MPKFMSLFLEACMSVLHRGRSFASTIRQIRIRQYENSRYARVVQAYRFWRIRRVGGVMTGVQAYYRFSHVSEVLNWGLI